MPKKKLPQTIEECNAELERTQKLLQQYENRNKMLNRKLSAEKRRERNHRIFLFGGFMESIVPELKTMTEDEGKDFLYHIAKEYGSTGVFEKNAPRGWKLDNTLGNKGDLYTLAGVVRSAEGLWAHGNLHALTLAACAAQENCISLRQLALSTLCAPTKQNTLLRQAVPFHGAESRRSEVNRYRNLSLQH